MIYEIPCARVMLSALKEFAYTDVLDCKDTGDSAYICRLLKTQDPFTADNNVDDEHEMWEISVPDGYMLQDVDIETPCRDFLDKVMNLPSWPGMLDLSSDRLVGIRIRTHSNREQWKDVEEYNRYADIMVCVAANGVELLPYDWDEMMECLYVNTEFSKFREHIVLITEDKDGFVYTPTPILPRARIRALEDLINKGAIPLFFMGTNHKDGSVIIYMAENEDTMNHLFGLSGKLKNTKKKEMENNDM